MWVLHTPAICGNRSISIFVDLRQMGEEENTGECSEASSISHMRTNNVSNRKSSPAWCSSHEIIVMWTPEPSQTPTACVSLLGGSGSWQARL